MPISSLTLGKATIDRLEFAPAELDELKAKLMALTRATVIVRSPVRNAEGKLDYIEVPDNGIQLAATVKALEFAVGKPKQMLDVSTNTGRSTPEAQNLGKLLSANPDITAKIVGALRDGVALSQAIPVQATSVTSTPQPTESQSVGAQR